MHIRKLHKIIHYTVRARSDLSDPIILKGSKEMKDIDQSLIQLVSTKLRPGPQTFKESTVVRIQD